MFKYKLKIYTENDELRESYQKHIREHISKMLQQGQYKDSGFDVLVPNNFLFENNNVEKLDMEISCVMFLVNDGVEYPCGYYLYPRSSLYKYGLRLTNSVGIIDSGYRGKLAGVFDVVSQVEIPKYSRLLQICSPTLSPITDIEIVNTLEDLGITSRGSGGFGSTGK